jgi:DNA-binding NtrC family response regulator
MTNPQSAHELSPKSAYPPPGLHPDSSPPATDRSPRTALVVDDEALIRWSVSETLAGLGLEVEQAVDGASTILAITEAATAFDVVVLDLRLPDVSDLSLLRHVRALLPASRVVLMTAFGTAEIMAGARGLGVIAVLNKPFALEELGRLLAPGGGAPLA